MANKSLKIRRNLLQGFGAVIIGGIVIRGISQWFAYRQERLFLECCAPHIRRSIIGTLIRRQQGMFFEKERFASSIEELLTFGNPITLSPEIRKMYDYSIENHPNSSIIRALTKQPNYRSYIGQAIVVPNPKPDELPIDGILCEAKESGIQLIAPPIDAKTCSEGTIKMGQ